jgi:hypothetical protein
MGEQEAGKIVDGEPQLVAVGAGRSLGSERA